MTVQSAPYALSLTLNVIPDADNIRDGGSGLTGGRYGLLPTCEIGSAKTLTMVLVSVLLVA